MQASVTSTVRAVAGWLRVAVILGLSLALIAHGLALWSGVVDWTLPAGVDFAIALVFIAYAVSMLGEE
ncbi:hypothetical protein [Haloarchaeobius amylolyticus]|uniref:hypothetical protein n=1 Tax=Haloarchaeobius amylolyticus TaxID=1198296 RepID=UPI002270E6C9|nr:hypothetical protein [Haloarchaeobius amylolyticus]